MGESVWINRRDTSAETSTDCVLTGHAAQNIKLMMSDREESRQLTHSAKPDIRQFFYHTNLASAVTDRR